MESNFGQELRRLRGAAGLSLRGLARQVHYDPGYVSKVENGAKKPTGELAAACDNTLETGGVLAHLVPSACAVPPVHRLPAFAVADDGEPAVLATRALPGVEVTVTRRGRAEEWNLVLPGGRTFGRAALRAQSISPTWTDGRVAVLGGDDIDALDRSPCAGLRSVIVTPLPVTGEGSTYLAMDHRTVRRQLQGDSAMVPGAFALDELTLGILWALANLDDALLADDTELTECQRLLRAELPAADISIPPELVAELSATSYGWLGSDACARYILRATESFTSRPVFWTREQRGEEASSWLFFRHKLDYLRMTSHRFGSRGDPVIRDFCIPEETVYTSPPAERVLVLLAAALMESLGIRIQVCTDPQLSTVDGFVLAPGTRAVIATWVRTEGRWHVDSTASRSALAAFGDVTRQAAAHQIHDAPSPVERLTALAGYLGLDWTWVTRRCGELSPHTCAGFARPRSRLLSTEGVDVACRYLAQLADPAA